MDEVKAMMQELGIPYTRSNYLDFIYMGDKPTSGAEVEADMPPEFDDEAGALSGQF
jgi:hypothetical protein